MPPWNKQDARRSTEERNQLVEENKGIVGYVLRRYANHPKLLKLGWDECVQDGFLVLLRAAELWDETRGVKFATYAGRCILHRFLSRIRGRQIDARMESFRPHLHEPACPEPPGELLDARERRLMDRALQRLPDRLRTIVRLRTRRGLDNAAIGRRLSLSRERARQLYVEALRLLRQRLRYGNGELRSAARVKA